MGVQVNQPNFYRVDGFRIIAALLVIAIHTGPLMSYSPYADFLLTGIAARIAVPFFFITSGYFFFRKLTGNPINDRRALHRYTRKIGKLYIIAIVLYIPLNLYSGYFSAEFSFVRFIQDIAFNGTFYHLWYMPALFLGMYVTYALYRTTSMNVMLILAAALYIMGLLGDSYYGLTVHLPALKQLYDGMFILFDYTRNGIFFAPMFIALGAFAAKQSAKPASLTFNLVGLTISVIMLFAEGILLHSLEWPRHDSMYVFLVPAVYFLLQSLLVGAHSERRGNRTGETGEKGAYLRQVSTWIYILHPAAIVMIRGLAKVTGLTTLLVTNSLIHYIAVSVLSILLAMLVARVLLRSKSSPAKASSHRAWAEISLRNLEHNVLELQRALPAACRIMAVVKANAYGHGSIRIAQALNKIGVSQFAVAEIEEGISLRQHGVTGDILILGYTSPDRVHDLWRYKLTQTIVNADYALALDRYGLKLKGHMKIDTGMNRLGEPYQNIDRILSCYKLQHVQVTGTFSHMSVSDSLDQERIAYSSMQADRLNSVVQQIREAGLDPGAVHLQSSYGILNHPSMEYDLARPGIALYGLLSHDEDPIMAQAELRPVLTLKATVAQVKDISAQSPIGYGHNCMASRDMRIAIITIGYADGIPKTLGDHGGYVLIRGQRASIVGSICMDQFMADVSSIEGIQQGDTATLIGQDGTEAITAGQIAARCGTLTNEIMSRIGSRVEHVYTSKGYPYVKQYIQ
ncbi:serine racemase VanT catalytic subunit [Paenibacillus marinisediminis]